MVSCGYMKREIKFRAWDGQIMLECHDIGVCEPDDAFGTNLALALNEEGLEYMQYTGLTDKNGKEIYEGDWFRPNIPNSRTAMLVEWDEHKASYKPFNDANYSYSAASGEVIGNMYENPELLKE